MPPLNKVIPEEREEQDPEELQPKYLRGLSRGELETMLATWRGIAASQPHNQTYRRNVELIQRFLDNTPRDDKPRGYAGPRSGGIATRDL